MIEFAWPYAFLLMIVPFLVYKFVPATHFKDNVALLVPELNDFFAFHNSSQKIPSKFKKGFLFLIWFALIFAAARPQWTGNMVEIPRSGRDLMLAVDLSGSMQIKDFKIKGQLTDRLTALKLIASDFIERRKGDRVGLIVFGSQAYLQAPLTFDVTTVKQLLMETAVGLAGQETAMGDAIGLAVKQLRNSPQPSRVLILITDGINNTGELKPEKAAELASHEKLKIHTIAIGSDQQQYQSLFGRGMLMAGEIDEKTLKLVAEKTGGSYFRAYNTDELVKIYQHIDKLEKRDQANIFYRPTIEIYYLALAAALAGIALLMGYECIIRRQT
ncbi:MAG: VWA domain-containing protein [Parachlamydiaceae bacterium]|nr:VWA domain-containing protein [Parachlamydiaceae bacterium]